MTLMLAITAMLIGAMLGLRFKVLVLVPANVIGSAATLGFGIMHSSSFWSALLVMALAITALQMGYIGGTAIRFAVVRPSKREGSSQGIAMAQRPAR
jgi:hypothetical protein